MALAVTAAVAAAAAAAAADAGLMVALRVALAVAPHDHKGLRVLEKTSGHSFIPFLFGGVRVERLLSNRLRDPPPDTEHGAVKLRYSAMQRGHHPFSKKFQLMAHTRGLLNHHAVAV